MVQKKRVERNLNLSPPQYSLNALTTTPCTPIIFDLSIEINDKYFDVLERNVK